MIIEAPKTLDRNDVVGVLGLIFDFKHLKEEGLSTHLRRGNIHAAVTFRTDGILCVNLHEDIGAGPRHKVLKESKRLVTFGRELKTALERVEDLRRERSKSTKRPKGGTYIFAPFCPLYQICPSFSEENYLCTYRLANRKYCDEYARLKRRLKT